MKNFRLYKRLFPEMSIQQTYQKVVNMYFDYSKTSKKRSEVVSKIAKELKISDNEVLMILQQSEIA